MSDKSWSELYEERKASRLAAEKTSIDEKRGFSDQDLNKPLEIEAKLNNVENQRRDCKSFDSNFGSNGTSSGSDRVQCDTINKNEKFPKPNLMVNIEIESAKEIARPFCDGLPKSPVTTESLSPRNSQTSGPPPTPDQLIAMMFENGGAKDNSPRPSRPSVPTPSKYGTSYGGAPSPGPNPSRNFNPPGYVPPTPPASRIKPGLQSHLETIRPLSQPPKQVIKTEKEISKPKNFLQSMREAKKDASLSSSSWEEEYLARKKARLND